MTRDEGWDWHAVARRRGADRHGRFNAGALPLRSAQAVHWYHADGPTHIFSADQMNRRIREFSAALAALGVRPRQRVAALIGRRPAAFATALATWRLGAIYVPLSTTLDQNQLRARLADCGPTLVITDAAHRTALGAVEEVIGEAKVLLTNGQGEASDHPVGDVLRTEPRDPGAFDTHLNDPATIMYDPADATAVRGYVFPHRAMISLVPYLRQGLADTDGGVLLADTDAGQWFSLLAAGLGPMTMGTSRVVYADPFTADGWWSSMRHTAISHLAADTATLAAITHAAPEPDAPQPRYFHHAGQPLPRRWIADLAPGFAARVHASYGPPETGVIMAHPHPTQHKAQRLAGALGRPLPGYRVGLLDEHGVHLVGEGTGELAIADNGFLLATGYWGHADQWHARFADGWFLTGQRAYRDRQGYYWSWA